MTPELFLEQLEIGKYAWPGGYPRFFIMGDGETLSFEAALENKELILDAYAQNDRRSDWYVEWHSINWEDTSLVCCHSGKPIPSAYGDDV